MLTAGWLVESVESWFVCAGSRFRRCMVRCTSLGLAGAHTWHRADLTPPKGNFATGFNGRKKWQRFNMHQKKLVLTEGLQSIVLLWHILLSTVNKADLIVNHSQEMRNNKGRRVNNRPSEKIVISYIGSCCYSLKMSADVLLCWNHSRLLWQKEDTE